MNYSIKKASLEDLVETAELFNLYRVFYRQESDVEKAKAFLKERFQNGESDIFSSYCQRESRRFCTVVQTIPLYQTPETMAVK